MKHISPAVVVLTIEGGKVEAKPEEGSEKKVSQGLLDAVVGVPGCTLASAEMALASMGFAVKAPHADPIKADPMPISYGSYDDEREIDRRIKEEGAAASFVPNAKADFRPAQTFAESEAEPKDAEDEKAAPTWWDREKALKEAVESAEARVEPDDKGTMEQSAGDLYPHDRNELFGDKLAIATVVAVKPWGVYGKVSCGDESRSVKIKGYDGKVAVGLEMIGSLKAPEQEGANPVLAEARPVCSYLVADGRIRPSNLASNKKIIAAIRENPMAAFAD